MKSDGMLADDDGDDEEPEPEPWEVAMEGGAPDPADGDFDPIDELEAEMDRRLDRKNTRGSPETLDELVRELREAERGSWWKDSREYDTSESPHGHARGTQTLDYHTGDEFRRDGERADRGRSDRPYPTTDIEEVIVGIDNALRTQFDRGHGGAVRGDRDRRPSLYDVSRAAVHGTPRIGPAPAGRPVRRSVGEGPIGDGRGVGSDRGLSRDLGSVPASTDDETVPSD